MPSYTVIATLEIDLEMEVEADSEEEALEIFQDCASPVNYSNETIGCSDSAVWVNCYGFPVVESIKRNTLV